MAEPAPSFQDLVRRRQQTAFVGREGELDAFVRNLRTPLEERALLISVSGQGGMGKTFLARQFAHLGRQQGLLVGWSDESEADAVEVMAALAHDLGEHSFRSFLDGERTYRARRHELESDPDVPSALIESLGTILGRGGVRLARHAPGVGVAFELVDEEAAGEAGRQAASVASFIARKVKDKDEAALVSDPIRVLTPRFVRGLAHAARDHPILLVFDTFEATRLIVQPWLRELLGGEYGPLPGNLMVVTAGRDPLDPNVWADYESVLQRLSVEAFDATASRTFLARHGITEPAIVDPIVDLAHGLPLLLATLASRSPSDPAEVGDAAGTATERFLKWLEGDEWRQLALRGAIPRSFNEDVLRTLLGERSDAAHALDWLRAQAFVVQRRDGWRYHDLVRSIFSSQMRRESPQAWREAHERLAKAFGDGPRKDVVEATYHAVAADPRDVGAGIAHLLAAWGGEDRQRALAIAQAMRQGRTDAGAAEAPAAAIVQALSEGRGDLDVVRSLEALLDADDVRLEAELRARIHMVVVVHYVETDRERARRHAQAALDTGQFRMVAHALNAMVAFWGEEWDAVEAASREALALADQADEGPPEILTALLGLRAAGALATGDAETAREATEAALALDPRDADLRAGLGSLLAARGDHRDALDAFERALELGVAREHEARESVVRLRTQLRDPGVLEAHVEALRSKPGCVDCWERLAGTLASASPEDAQRVLGQAPAGDEAVVRYGRALALHTIGQTAQAVELLDALVASEDACPEALVLRASIGVGEDGAEAAELLRRAEAAGDSKRVLSRVMSAYRRARDFDGVERCATVLMSRSSLPHLRLVRAEARRMSGKLDGAREDLLDVGDVDEVMLIQRRAELARDVGMRDLALAEARRLATLLDPEAASPAAVNGLGLLLSHLGEWDESLVWLDHGLAREPEDLALRYNRLVTLVRRDGAEPHADALDALRRWLDDQEGSEASYVYASAGLAALAGAAEALELLAHACPRLAEAAEWAAHDRAFDDLRADPRFAAALA